MLAPGPLTVPRRLIPGLLLVHHQDAADQRQALDELERRGLVAAGKLIPEAAAVVEVMTDPSLVISVEVSTSAGDHRSTLWATRNHGVWGRPVDDDAFELRHIDPIQLPLLLAQLTGLGHRPPPPFTGSVSVDAAALTMALDWRGEDPDGALGVLVAAGVELVWADRLLIAYEMRQAEWTVSSVWTDEGADPRIVDIHVIDAGPAGYWRLVGVETHITHTVVSTEGLIRELRNAVPVAGADASP